MWKIIKGQAFCKGSINAFSTKLFLGLLNLNTSVKFLWLSRSILSTPKNEIPTTWESASGVVYFR
jgi:hypothetical protein